MMMKMISQCEGSKLVEYGAKQRGVYLFICEFEIREKGCFTMEMFLCELPKC